MRSPGCSSGRKKAISTSRSKLTKQEEPSRSSEALAGVHAFAAFASSPDGSFSFFLDTPIACRDRPQKTDRLRFRPARTLGTSIDPTVSGFVCRRVDPVYPRLAQGIGLISSMARPAWWRLVARSLAPHSTPQRPRTAQLLPKTASKQSAATRVKRDRSYPVKHGDKML